MLVASGDAELVRFAANCGDLYMQPAVRTVAWSDRREFAFAGPSAGFTAIDAFLSE